MKASEFEKFYMSFVRLYGVIESQQALEVIQRYFPELSEEELHADMKKRLDTETRGYQIRVSTPISYVVCSETDEEEDIDYMICQHNDLPIWSPEDPETLWSYGEKGVPYPQEAAELLAFFRESGTESREEKQEECVKTIVDLLQKETFENALMRIRDTLAGYGLSPRSFAEEEQLASRLLKICDNLRRRVNFGYTDSEIRELNPRDPEKRKEELKNLVEGLLESDDPDLKALLPQMLLNTDVADELHDYMLQLLEEYMADEEDEEDELPKA